MRSHEDRTIGSTIFRIKQLPFGKARPAFLKISQIVMPALATLQVQPGQSIPIEAALRSALGSVSDADLQWLSETFAFESQYSIDGGTKWPMLAPNMEAVFGGNMLLFFKWILACAEVNFADFFDAFRGGNAPAL